MNDDTLFKTLKEQGIDIAINAPLARYTSYKVGGAARFFVSPKSKEEMITVLRLCESQGVEFMLLGGGSNTLIADDGFDGVVIHPMFKEILIQSDNVIADAGAVLVEVARKSVGAGLTGLEWAVGVPGTVGGAVRGNAGCMDGEIKDTLEWVEVYKDGELHTMRVEECQFGYRDSIFKRGGGIVVRACFKLKHNAGNTGAQALLNNIQYRIKTQPKVASCGCIFKNVPRTLFAAHTLPDSLNTKSFISAGWIIEQSGCKGMQVGGAEVSSVHANFIVNNGNATASDILALIQAVKEKVQKRFGVELVEEIQII